MEYIVKTKSYYHRGVELLTFTAKIASGINEKSDALGAELLENCTLWAEEKLFPALASDYDENPDKNKRFTSGFSYSLSQDAELHGNGTVTVRVSAVLRKKRGGEVRKNVSEYVCDAVTGKLLPGNLKKY